MKDYTIKVTLTTDMLGSNPSDPDVHREYIASKAPDAPSIEEEVAAIGIDGVEHKGTTVFARDKEGNPVLWNYVVQGFLKSACKAMRKVPGSAASKIKAYKQEIDTMVAVFPRQIPIEVVGEIGSLQRPLRASTPQGERVSLANSETIGEGSSFTFTVRLLNPDLHEAMLMECLEYGETFGGFGQWRGGGFGRFTFEVL
jgi:hypothetical protein